MDMWNSMPLYHPFFEMSAFIYVDLVKTEVGLPFISANEFF